MLVLKWHTNNRYYQNRIDNELIHTTQLKSEAKHFKNARVLKGRLRDKTKWVREYV